MRWTATLEIMNSRSDMYGNRYWAFRYTDHETGAVVEALGDHESNIHMMLLRWDGAEDWCRTVLETREERPIRQFNQITKGWKYAGCQGEDIQAFVLAGLKSDKASRGAS